MTRHYLITGANRGIGAAMARKLAASGQSLTLLCRDESAARDFIKTLPSQQKVRCLQGDLGSISGIYDAARAIRDLPPLDGLIHNAAIWPQQKVLNGDDLEQAFVTNHLAPFLLNLELEERFKQHGTRVVQITAGLYPMGDRNFSASARGDNFSALKTYASTKLLNLATTMTFAERWEGSRATINAVHPGVVRTDLGAMPGIKGALLKMVKRLWLTPERGAEAPVFLSTDPSLQGVNGRFYNRFKAEPLAPFMQEREFLAAIWNQALQYTRRAG